MKQIEPPRLLTPEEAWQITCHEAGHAVVAARLDVLFEYVERGAGEFGQLKPVFAPNDERHHWTPQAIIRMQLMYAAGAAADLMLFGIQREYAYREDRRLHQKLEELSGESRPDGWEHDVRSATRILDQEAIEKVARSLDRRGKLTDEQVYRLLGRKLPWDRDE